MDNKKRRSAGISISYVYFVLNTVITVFMSAYILRTVGKTNYGVYQSMSAFASYLVLLEFGTGTIMARNAALCQKDGTNGEQLQKNVSTIWSMTVILSVGICLLAGVFYLLIDTIYGGKLTPDQLAAGKTLFIFAAVNLLASFLTQTLNGLIVGCEYYLIGKTVLLVKLLLRTGLLAVWLSITPRVEAVAAVDALLSVVSFLVLLGFCLVRIKVRFTFRYFDLAIFRTSMPMALALLIQTIVNSANTNVDKFLISIMMTPDDVAVYAVAMLVFGMYSSVATLPVTMYMPQVAGNIKKGMTGRALTETLVQPCRMNLIITGMIACGFITVGRPFIRILYGEDYLQAWLCAVIVMIPTFVNMFNAVIINVLDVLMKRHVQALVLLCTTVLNIAMTVAGIHWIGMPGAALATGISLVVQTVIMNIYYQTKLHLSIGLLIRRSFGGIWLCLPAAAVPAAAVQFFLKGDIPKLLAGGSLYVITFAALFLLCGANRDEKAWLARHAARLTGRK